jgi:hypothetical protein
MKSKVILLSGNLSLNIEGAEAIPPFSRYGTGVRLVSEFDV